MNCEVCGMAHDLLRQQIKSFMDETHQRRMDPRQPIKTEAAMAPDSSKLKTTMQTNTAMMKKKLVMCHSCHLTREIDHCRGGLVHVPTSTTNLLVGSAAKTSRDPSDSIMNRIHC